VAGVAAAPISPGPDNINNQTIKAGKSMNMVCYSPDDKMIATNGDTLKLEVAFLCMEWKNAGCRRFR
jgi:hypothetical protein